MKKHWIILSALYLYLELLMVMFPMLRSWSGVMLPPSVDRWLESNYLVTAILLFFIPTVILLATGILSAVSASARPPVSPAESIELIRTQMVMRLVQVPGFLMIFAASVLFFLFVFTIGFSFFFIILDFISIVITGLFSIPVYISLYKNGLICKERQICYCILSFAFCADVIVSILCYRQVKGRSDH